MSEYARFILLNDTLFSCVYKTANCVCKQLDFNTVSYLSCNYFFTFHHYFSCILLQISPISYFLLLPAFKLFLPAFIYLNLPLTNFCLPLKCFFVSLKYFYLPLSRKMCLSFVFLYQYPFFSINISFLVPLKYFFVCCPTSHHFMSLIIPRSS
jgi:hypothetical protein